MTRKKTDATSPAQTTRPIPRVEKPQATPARDNKLVVPLAEEELTVDKRWVKEGEVIVHKTVESIPQSVPVDLAYEEVSIERVPVNRLFNEEERPQQRQEGDTLIIPVLEEQPVVIKRYLLREEIRITKKRAVRHQELDGTIRREHLQIDSTGNLEATTD